MSQDGQQVHISETEASAGSKEGVVRWVLIVGTLLAIVLLTLVWTTGAMTTDGVDQPSAATAEMTAQQDGAATDTITGGSLDDSQAVQPIVKEQDGLSVVENNPDAGE